MWGRTPYILAARAVTLTLAPGASAAEGSLDQLAGTAGCVTETGRSVPSDAATAGQCTDGRALTSTAEVAVSPTGATST